MVRRARLAVFNGHLDEALTHLGTARHLLAGMTIPSQDVPLTSLVEGQLWLTLGDFAQAEARFSEAHTQAEMQQEPLLAAESLLGLAQTRLSRGELESDTNNFSAAERQFQGLESTSVYCLE